MKNCKKLISFLSAMCMAVTMVPFSAYAENITAEISLDEFSSQLSELQAEYDENLFGSITIKNDSEFYHVDGEEFVIEENDDTAEADISNGDVAIPSSVVENYCDMPEISAYSADDENGESEDVTLTKDDLEYLGFEVEVNGDTAEVTREYQTARVIVKSKYDINPLDSVAVVEGYSDLHIVQFDDEESAKEAVDYYENQPLVEYAEPDIVMSSAEIESDTEDFTVIETDAAGAEYSASSSVSNFNYGNHLSWGSEFIGIDDYVDYLSDVDTLLEITVGIIDTGIDTDHDYLEDRIVRTYYNTSYSGDENDENDDKGHGTHVAGIIVDNTTDNVKIKAYKVLSENGTGTMSAVVAAVEYAANDGVDVINMSLGANGTSKTMEKAINKATDAGIAVCVAAGNNGGDASKNCPANVESAITVTAFGSGNEFPYWACYGSIVDMMAPGISIYSTYLDNGYETLSGTSMASPMMAAAMAMVKSKYPNESVEETFARIDDSSHHVTSPEFLKGLPVLYIGDMTSTGMERTVSPVFSIEGGDYWNPIQVELSCEDENAQIYYTLDGSRANSENSILYTGAFTLSEVTSVHAVAYSDGKLKSLQSIANYYITSTDDEGNFEIDSDGIIMAYNGTSTHLTIPDTINGITVTGIGKSVFSGSDMVMIKFPDTLTSVGKSAFSRNYSLTSVFANNLKTVGDHAFYYCKNLETIDLTTMEEIGKYAFFFADSFQSVYNDKITTIEKYAFNHVRYAVSFSFPNVTRVEYGGLATCTLAETILLPKVEWLGTNALLDCDSLQSLDLPCLTTLENSTCGSQFAACSALSEINIPNFCGDIPRMAFYATDITEMDLPGATSVGESAFDFCTKLTTILLENATAISENAFDDCYALETIYIPKVTTIGNCGFTLSHSIKTMFAPSLETTDSIPGSNANIYLSEKFTSSSIATKYYTYNIIAPSGSYAEEWAEEYGHTFIPSDSRETINDRSDNTDDVNVRACGRSIRITNAGLRFGFSWNDIDEIESLAEDIEYGFIYHYNFDDEPYTSDELTIDNVGTNSIKRKIATNVNDTDEGKKVYNLVFTDIPAANQATNISARAYVCIDGMYFYSNTLNGSFAEVSGLVLADKDIDENTKQAIRNLLA